MDNAKRKKPPAPAQPTKGGKKGKDDGDSKQTKGKPPEKVKRRQYSEALKEMKQKFTKRKKMLDAWTKWRKSDMGQGGVADAETGWLLVPDDVFTDPECAKTKIKVEVKMTKKLKNRIDLDYAISKEVLKQWKDIKIRELQKSYGMDAFLKRWILPVEQEELRISS